MNSHIHCLRSPFESARCYLFIFARDRLIGPICLGLNENVGFLPSLLGLMLPIWSVVCKCELLVRISFIRGKRKIPTDEK